MANKAKKQTLVQQFNARLKTYRTSTKTSMNAARDCAVLALEEFKAHGNLSLCQQFFEAMPRNFHRRSAFALWVMAHAPVVVDGTKFLKDKGEDAVAFNLDAAKATPFWDFAPDKEEVMFASKDIISAVERTIKKFRTAAEKKKLVEGADKTLVEMEHLVAAIKDGKHLQPVNDDAADEGDDTVAASVA